jgi:hypothetical protein
MYRPTISAWLAVGPVGVHPARAAVGATVPLHGRYRQPSRRPDRVDAANGKKIGRFRRSSRCGAVARHRGGVVTDADGWSGGDAKTGKSLGNSGGLGWWARRSPKGPDGNSTSRYTHRRRLVPHRRRRVRRSRRCGRARTSCRTWPSTPAGEGSCGSSASETGNGGRADGRHPSRRLRHRAAVGA